MSQFISKNALESIPLSVKNHTGEEKKYARLHSAILKTSVYLQKLVANEVNTKPISLGFKGMEIVRIRLALQLINKLESFTTIENAINKNDVKFDQTLKNQLIDFQNDFEAKNNGVADGVVTAKVIHFIDYYLNSLLSRHKGSSLISRDFKSGELEAFPLTTKDIRITLSDDATEIRIRFNGEDYNIDVSDLNKPHFSYVRTNSDGTIRVLPGLELTQRVQDSIGANFNNNTLDQGSNLGYTALPFDLYPQRLPIQGEEFYLNGAEELFESISKTPPAPQFTAKNSTVHTVKHNESAVDIVHQYYYGAENVKTLTNPYNGNEIFEFPELAPFPAGERNDDFRLKFYLRFLYYTNIEVDDSGIIQSYGLEANNFDIDEEFLSDYNLFDTAYSSNNPESVFPNYYRLLNAETQQNNASDINFDQNGECTSFSAIENKKLVIPDREVVDAIFYHLNFRPKDWLEETATGVMDYIDDIGSFISDISAENVFNQASQYVQESVTQVYNNSFAFMSAMYDFGINDLSEHWPRGFGGKLEFDLGITWGYPIYTDFKSSTFLYRKLTRTEECVLSLKEEGSIGVGLDTGVGYNIGLSAGASGKKRKGLGIEADASAKIGLSFILNNEYEFPVRREETALLACLITFTDVIEKGAELLGMLNLINFNPRSYLTFSRFEIGSVASAQGSVGVTTPLNSTEEANNSVTHEDIDNDTTNDGSTTIVDIFKKLPLLEINGSVNGGLGFQWTGKYDDNPYVPDTDRREPSQVDFEITYAIQGEVTVDVLITQFLNKLFGDLIDLGDFLEDGFSFDQGFKVGAIFSYKRGIAANSLTEAYINLLDHLASVQDIDDDFGQDDGAMTFIDPNAPNGISPWKIRLKFGTFHGDVGGLAKKGNESYILINPYRLLKTAKKALNGSFDFSGSIDGIRQNIFPIFHGLQGHYKMGLSAKGEKKKIVTNILDLYTGPLFGFDDDTKAFFKTAGKVPDKEQSKTEAAFRRLLLNTGFAVEVSFTFDFSQMNLQTLLEYMFKRLYGIYYLRKNNDRATANKFANDLKTGRQQFEKTWIANHKDEYDKYSKQDLYIAVNAHMLEAVNTALSDNDISGTDFVTSFEVFCSIYSVFQQYYIANNSPTNDDVGCQEYKVHTQLGANNAGMVFNESIELKEYILPALAFSAGMQRNNAAVEAKVGIDLAGEFSEELGEKIRLSFGLEAYLTYRGLLVDDGDDVTLAGDPESNAYQVIQQFFQTAIDNPANRCNQNELHLRGSIIALPQ